MSKSFENVDNKDINVCRKCGESRALFCESCLLEFLIETSSNISKYVKIQAIEELVEELIRLIKKNQLILTNNKGEPLLRFSKKSYKKEELLSTFINLLHLKEK